MKQREESWKYNAQRSILDELLGDLSRDETLCRMLDIKDVKTERLRFTFYLKLHRKQINIEKPLG